MLAKTRPRPFCRAQIIGLGGKCLTLAANGVTQTLATCTGAASQRFRLFTNGQIRGLNQNCLGNAGDDVTVEGQLCTADSSVNLWTVPAERLLQANEVGLLPWLPLTHFDTAPEVLLRECRERIDPAQCAFGYRRGLALSA